MNRLFLILLVFIFSGCNLLEDECDSAPDAVQSDNFNINNRGFGNCEVVPPGWLSILDWGYMYGSDGQKNGNNSGYTKFRWTFDPPEGFASEDGTPIIGEYITEDNSPMIFALPNAPQHTSITVSAFNKCGESEEASGSIEVRKEKVVAYVNPGLPQAIAAPIVGHHNGKVYVSFGTYNGVYSSTGDGKETFIFDLATRMWSTRPLPSTNLPIRDRYTQVQFGSIIYMINRIDNFNLKYDLVANTVERLADNPYHNTVGDYNGMQALYYNNKIYAGPARRESSSNQYIFTYDPATNAWTEEHVMPATVAPPQDGSMRELGEAAFMLGGKMYFLMDGRQGYVYNPDTKTGSTFSIGTGVTEHIGGAFVHNGKAYILTNGNTSTTHGYLYEFNASTYALTKVNLLQGANCNQTDEWLGPSILSRIVEIDGEIYVVGGTRDCGTITPCKSDVFLKVSP